MNVGSLFSGIGGLDYGLERAGMTVRWQIEQNPYCNKVLAKHWPDVPRYGDIKEIDPNDLEPVDLICGGIPCQPVSLAGKRKGESDERWLWPYFVRFLRVLRPTFGCVENVPGLIDRGLGRVLSDLAALGYDAIWEVLPASIVGSPQRRQRLFIVAYPEGFPQRPRLRPRESETVGWRRSSDGRSQGDTWPPEPNVGRVAHGVPARVDRLRGLGNAVVPQVAEWVGRRIMEVSA